jgi:hypothetical protein
MEFFLNTLFASMKRNGGKRPGLFDMTFLMTRYKTEHAMVELPTAVRKIVRRSFMLSANYWVSTAAFKMHLNRPQRRGAQRSCSISEWRCGT